MEDTLLSEIFLGDWNSHFEIDRIGWLGEEERKKTGNVENPRIFDIQKMEWGYRLPFALGSRRKANVGRGTQAMTCAGVSSLLAVRLGSGSRLGSERRQLIDKTILGGLASISETVIPWKFSKGGSFHRNVYYHLYSLEKALDLAGVTSIDGVDWYRHIVPGLLEAQGADGSWGLEGADPSESYRRMATAFSLLFLKRATRSLAVEQSLPTYSGKGIDPGGGKGPAANLERGRVRIASLGGTARISDLLEAVKRKDKGAIGWLREAAEGLSPELAPHLLPDLTTVLGAGGQKRREDSVEAIVRDITALDEPAIETILQWHRHWLDIESVAGREGAAAREELERMVTAGDLHFRLRARACLHLARRGEFESVPRLIVALGDPEAEVRAVAAPALRSLTGEAFLFDARGEPDQRAQQIVRWQGWWESTGKGKLIPIRFARLRDKLERSSDPEERARVREAVLALGPGVLAEVEAVIATASFAFDWVEIRNTLRGIPLGL